MHDAADDIPDDDDRERDDRADACDPVRSHIEIIL